MKRIIIICLLLVGCGWSEDSFHVNFHTVDSATLEALGADNIYGYGAFIGETCDVYMREYDFYPSDACRISTMGHEIEHCRRGMWHGLDNIIEPACKIPVKGIKVN